MTTNKPDVPKTDVQGEPAAWLVTGPYEKVAFAYKETAEKYCAGLNMGYGEEAYKIRELYAALQPAEQQPVPDVAELVGVPDLTSTIVNDCCWTFVDAMPHNLPAPIFNNLKPALYEALKQYHDALLTASTPQPAEQQPIRSDLARDAANHLTNWLEMDICECEGGHYCGYNEVKRTRDALLEAAERQPAPDVAKLSREAIAELIKGMAVSVDVSTGESDFGNRYFGVVDEVQWSANERHGMMLLVQEPEANFATPVSPDVSALVEALEAIATWVSHPVATIARKALAAHRQLEGES